MRLLKLTSVSSRLAGLGMLAFAVTTSVGWSGWRGMRDTEASVHSLIQHLAEVDALKQAHNDLLSVVIHEHELFPTKDLTARAEIGSEIRRLLDGVSTALQALEPTLLAAPEEGSASDVLQQLPEYRRGVLAFAAAPVTDEKSIPELQRLDHIAERMRERINVLTNQRRIVAADAVRVAERASFRARVELVATTILGALLATLAGLALMRSITRPLKKSVELLTSVAAGDFTQRLDVTRDDELGDMSTAMNEALGSMHRAIAEVRDAADAVATASFELSAAGDQISSGAQAQASSLEETSASLAEMTASVKQNAENAQHASDAGRTARGAAEQGGHTVGSVGIAMTELETSAKRVVDIITAIDEIAFQTNILALNAAVEAARAGEQGRGFAVVAAEVRSLAQRSAASAKEIRSLIIDSQVKVENVRTLVDHSREALREIVGSVESMSAMVDDIAVASREQATGIDQLNRTVAQMDKVTQSNAAQTEELSGTAQSMASQAEQLRHLVGRFKIGVEERVAKMSNRAHSIKRRYELARIQDGEDHGLAPFASSVASSVASNVPGNDGEFSEF